MNVLLLGPADSPLAPIIRERGDTVVAWEAPLDTGVVRANSIEFAVSYRYRHIIGRQVIEYLRGRVINLHISLLPWNRGADPNLWSFLEDTPKGVSIHYIDEGIDTGDIIAQREVFFEGQGDTLHSTYKVLEEKIISLFQEHWPQIATGQYSRRKQPHGGSYHRTVDKTPFLPLIERQGWQTPVDRLIGKAREADKNEGADGISH